MVATTPKESCSAAADNEEFWTLDRFGVAMAYQVITLPPRRISFAGSPASGVRARQV
jgi:hypothetical protein